MSFFIQDAFAQQAQQAPMGNSIMYVMMIGMVVIFYFLLWRPQSKRAKEHKELMAGLTKGDEIITSGGLIGKIAKVSDDFVVITVADNVELKMQKASIATILPKGTIKSI